MTNPLIRKLGSVTKFSDDDVAALEALCGSVTEKRAGTDLIEAGDRPSDVFLLLEGWAYRYKYTDEGDRQIVAYLIPGDLCDPHVFILDEMDHSIGLLSDAKFARIPKEAVVEITDKHPVVARALWWSTLVDEAVLRHWLLNIGQRDGYIRMAHLFCELWVRMGQVGLTTDGEFSLPLTQEQLGDTLGLTSVHTNRMVQKMRAEGLVTLHSKHLTIHDIDRLRTLAGFDPQYLHLRPRS